MRLLFKFDIEQADVLLPAVHVALQGAALRALQPFLDGVRPAGRSRCGRMQEPREVADAADVVFASLPTPDVVRHVALADDCVVPG